MTAFWITAAALLGGALLFVVLPLLRGPARRPTSTSSDELNLSVYRDQLRELESDLANGAIGPEQHDAARIEIEQRLLQDLGAAEHTQARRRTGNRVAALVVGLAVPVLAVALYALLGSPQAMDPATRTAGHPESSESVTQEQFAAMVEKLAARLRQGPGTVEEWTMLARSYYVLQRYREAGEAYANAITLAPQDAQLLADYADALGMSQGRSLQGEPERLIARALKADPDNLKALALAGSAAFYKKEYTNALAHWQRILEQAPADSELARSIAASMAEARTLGGLDTAGPSAQGVPQAHAGIETAAPGSSITGTIRLAPALAQRVSPTDTLYVFARATEGPRMPLAILRKQVKDLPLDFSLDDSMSMAPNTRLSTAGQVVVGARVSKSGDASERPGDFQGWSQPVRPGASGLRLVIDAEVR